MKVLVISDTHGRLENAKKVIESLIPIKGLSVCHCGDYVSDARLIQKYYPQLTVHSVYGNCDVGFGEEYTQVVSIEGVPIYMCHGHRYGVKWGEYDELVIDTSAHDAKVALCGHSHMGHLQKSEGILVMNPGSLSQPRDSRHPSYGILEIEDGKVISAHIMQIKENGVLIEHPVSVRFNEN